MQPWYLRDTVRVDTLVDNWYAWFQLLSSAAAPSRLTEQPLKIMHFPLSLQRVL